MRYPAIVAAVLLAGCAELKTTVSPPPDEIRSVVRLYTERGVRDLELTRNTFDRPRYVRMQAAAGLAALPEIYRQLGIPDARLLNEDESLFGRRYMNVRHALNGVRMSRYLNCGSTFVGGPDTYHLVLTVMTVMEQVGPGSEVRTWVDATGRDPTGAGTPPVQCSSTGLMEREIARRLQGSGPGGAAT